MSARVLAVAQAFKGTLDLPAVAAALTRGIEIAGAVPRLLLGSDGGDGLLDALERRLVRRTRHPTRDPLLRSIDAEIGWLDGTTAVVESRLACGLALLAAHERDPLRTTSRGVGELIDAAVAAGASTVYVGLGGSGTMDGGLGMARVWDWRPHDRAGRPLEDRGGALAVLAGLERGRAPAARVIGLADVRSPLLGPGGAARFAAQKGADAAATRQLVQGLETLVGVSAPWNGPTHARRPGAGAAGGLGFGLLVFGAAELEPGAGWVLDGAGWDAAVAEADLIVTGEGAYDGTSGAGKLTGEVLARARAAGVGVLLVAPVVQDAPAGVVVETGGGHWDAAELTRRTASGLRRALRLPPR